MEQLKISIIILTYNNFSNIFQNLKSISEQTYNNYEVIIRDDCSNNFPKKEIEQYCEELFGGQKYFIISNNENVGTVKNANLSRTVSSGDIIVPLSQDDCFADSNVLSEIASFFTNNLDCSVCIGLRQGHDSGTVLPAEEDIKYLSDKDKNILLIRLIYSNFISGSTLYCRKDYFEKIGLFDEKYRLLEDHPAIIKLVSRNADIKLLNKVTILYGERGVSSGKFNPIFVEDNVKLYNELLSEYEVSHRNTLFINLIKYRINWWMACKGDENKKNLTIRFKFFWYISKIYCILFKKDLCLFRIEIINNELIRKHLR